MYSQDTVLDERHISILLSRLSTEPSESIIAETISPSTSTHPGQATDLSADSTRNGTVGSDTEVPRDVWNRRLTTAESLVFPYYSKATKYVRKRSGGEWIWEDGPTSIYYCVRQKDIWSDTRHRHFSITQSRCLQMVRFLQLCNEQKFPCKAQTQWLRMASREDFFSRAALFEQFGRTLAMLILEIQSFFVRHPEKVPRAYISRRRGRPRGIYCVERYWNEDESVRDNLIKHLDRLYASAFNELGECGMWKDEAGFIEESCLCTLHSKITEDSVLVGGYTATSVRPCVSQEGLRLEKKSMEKAPDIAVCLSSPGAVLGLRSTTHSSNLAAGSGLSGRNQDRVLELCRQWRNSSISCRSIVLTAYAYGFEQGLIDYLEILLPALPCHKDSQSQIFVTPQGMESVLGYFVLILCGELSDPPLSPHDDPAVLQDLSKALDWCYR